MKIPKGKPDFDNGTSQIWFDDMIENDNGLYDEIKYENNQFWWYSRICEKWFLFDKYLGTSQEELLEAYGKWINKKLLEE